MSTRERAARVERLAALRQAGVEPFPARVGPRIPIAEVRRRFDVRSAESLVAIRTARSRPMVLTHVPESITSRR